MTGIRFSPATVAAVFSLGIGVAVCIWGYQDLSERYQDRQQTIQDARHGISRHHDDEDAATQNAEQEPELGEAVRNVPSNNSSPHHP